MRRQEKPDTPDLDTSILKLTLTSMDFDNTTINVILSINLFEFLFYIIKIISLSRIRQFLNKQMIFIRF